MLILILEQLLTSPPDQLSAALKEECRTCPRSKKRIRLLFRKIYEAEERSPFVATMVNPEFTDGYTL